MTFLVQVGHGLTMVILFKNVGTNHGQHIARTMVDHQVQPCSSPRGVLMLMSAHQVFDHD